MFDIQWRTGFGYGDFVSGLGYAHNASIKYNTKVNITFHWEHGSSYRESPQDPETIIERMWYIYNTMEKSEEVKIFVKTSSKPKYRFINHLDEFNPIHGLWNTTLHNTYTNKVVLWRSKYNTFFPGTDKDPAHDQWDKIIDWLTCLGYSVSEVTYRTPISHVMKDISECSFGIGYDGMIHQLFKYMWKPLIVLCKRHRLNRLLVPQAALEECTSTLMDRGLDYYLIKSFDNITEFRLKHKQYLQKKLDPTGHPLFGKPIL